MAITPFPVFMWRHLRSLNQVSDDDDDDDDDDYAWRRVSGTRAAMVHVIQGPFRTTNCVTASWEGVVLARRLSLGSIYSIGALLITEPFWRSMLFTAVNSAALPIQNRDTQYLETTCLALLVLLSLLPSHEAIFTELSVDEVQPCVGFERDATIVGLLRLFVVALPAI